MVFVGVQHMQGTSRKDGKEYNFFSIQAIARNPRTEGFAVQTVNVSPQVWEQFPLQLGDQFRATTDGYIVPLDEKLRIDLKTLGSVL